MTAIALIYLLFKIVIIGCVLWIIWWAISQIPMPPPIQIVVRVIFALVVALIAISWLLPLASPGHCAGLLC